MLIHHGYADVEYHGEKVRRLEEGSVYVEIPDFLRVVRTFGFCFFCFLCVIRFLCFFFLRCDIFYNIVSDFMRAGLFRCVFGLSSPRSLFLYQIVLGLMVNRIGRSGDNPGFDLVTI